ncbi:transcriptional regulator, ArsR family [Desulfuromusa kysingii]|uniref:Transcriptional regulator, ArsR family n=1 Tax=Desulfuromusa kysingii TaxID=37625 RepID=A0A1H4DSP4_9BACT|nr:metalloregulator ArsR/SmtB family transcription factor [Desulfuromusa kysingii]SEA75528.1 transcriptional regulator, ArsR family [Desulfuromusa kysingii]
MKKLAKNFKALSDETRLRIIALLSYSELCVCDLMAVLQLPQSTVSRHLAYLKSVEMVDDRREGVWMYYRLMNESEFGLGKLLPALLEQLSAVDKTQHDLISLRSYLKQRESNSCT